MKKHVNIPVFIPHYGCPNDCVFCNQRKITGKKCYSRDEVINEIETALSTVDRESTEVELAFFGGALPLFRATRCSDFSRFPIFS